MITERVGLNYTPIQKVYLQRPNLKHGPSRQCWEGLSLKRLLLLFIVPDNKPYTSPIKPKLVGYLVYILSCASGSLPVIIFSDFSFTVNLGIFTIIFWNLAEVTRQSWTRKLKHSQIFYSDIISMQFMLTIIRRHQNKSSLQN